MILMQINDLIKRFGADIILNQVKLEIKTNDKIALVGRNGAGKSTLLKIMAGVLPFDSGEIHKSKEVSLGYLAQHTDISSNNTIYDEMLSVFQLLIDEEKALRKMEEEMGNPDIISEKTQYEKLLKAYDQRQLNFKEQGGYQYEARIRSVLNGMRFSSADFFTLVDTLSGGQKTRLALAKLLLQQPDLLILDEPTNHLDIETLTWLENYLNSYTGAYVIVSHDRYFLDKTIETVYELSRTKSKKYYGNYTHYLLQKAKDYEQDQKQYLQQQSEIKKLEDYVSRNLARASTTKMAQSRRRKLEKMDRLETPAHDEKSASFSFDVLERSGNDVLKIEDLSFSYEINEPPIFENINFNVNRSDRIAIVGHNGVGKTTLLKIITKQLAATSGTLHYGAKLTIGYYDQEQQALHDKNTVLNELWDEYPLMNEKDIRTILGNFLFSGDDVLKTIHSLSGGEKARVALSKLMLKKANLLILDEPTNHLDLDSKEILEASLIHYPGTIIFVSHDRYFINEIATHVVEMKQDQATVYLGDYDYYMDKKRETEEIKRLNSPIKEKENRLEPTSFAIDKLTKQQARKRTRRMAEIEQLILAYEAKISENEMTLCDEHVFGDHEQTLKLTTENEQLNAEVEGLMEEWAALEAEEI